LIASEPDVIDQHVLDHPVIAIANQVDVILVLHQTVAAMVIGRQMLGFYNGVQLAAVSPLILMGGYTLVVSS